ncbi:hypothetical protein LXL04_034656 [Taraxacum kok-saghyz]
MAKSLRSSGGCALFICCFSSSPVFVSSTLPIYGVFVAVVVWLMMVVGGGGFTSAVSADIRKRSLKQNMLRPEIGKRAKSLIRFIQEELITGVGRVLKWSGGWDKQHDGVGMKATKNNTGLNKAIRRQPMLSVRGALAVPTWYKPWGPNNRITDNYGTILSELAE